MYTILHISDLHRSSEDPVSNAELLQALIQDRDRCAREDPPISSPDAIVVSGDIIQGAPFPEESTAADSELAAQYEIASDFLAQLAEQFVDGDRARVVIAPGNHDVDWNTARSAMEEVELSDWPADLRGALSSPSSDYRLDLSGRPPVLYRISDQTIYEARFDRFRAFEEHFYQGTTAPISVPDQRYVRLFELHQGRIIVASFNSMENNDCYSSQGSIPRNAIAQAYLQIRDIGRPYDLRIAVWHHHVSGPPHSQDYMDIDRVQRLIGTEFRLGLHGHQHRIEATPYHIRLPDPHSMAVVSAGSLCAGPGALPVGFNRQYNVIQLSDDLATARVHCRELELGMQFAPRILAGFGLRSYADLELPPPQTPVGTLVDTASTRLASITVEAEEELHRSNHARVETLLRPHVADLSLHGRQVLVQAAIEDKRWDDAVSALVPPQSILELTQIVNASCESREFQSAREYLGEYGDEVDITGPDRAALEGQIMAREKVRSA